MTKKTTGAARPPRKHNPKWKDNTSAERSKRKLDRWQAAAIRDGFENWSSALTAWAKGTHRLVEKGNDDGKELQPTD